MSGRGGRERASNRETDRQRQKRDIERDRDRQTETERSTLTEVITIPPSTPVHLKLCHVESMLLLLYYNQIN